MKKYNIKRINTFLDQYGRNKYHQNAKHKWIEEGCADTKEEIEKQLLKIIKNQCRSSLSIDEIRVLRIKIENRYEESLLMDTLTNIHKLLEIDDLFETFRKINQK